MLNCAVIVRLLCGYCPVIVRLLSGLVALSIGKVKTQKLYYCRRPGTLLGVMHKNVLIMQKISIFVTKSKDICIYEKNVVILRAGKGDGAK